MLKSTRRDVSRCVVTLILDLGPHRSPSTLVGDELCLATADQVIDDGQCVSPGLARNGHVDSVAQCPLIGAKRKTFARVELFRFWHQTDMVDLAGDVRSRRNSGSRIRWVRKNRDQKGLFDRTKRLFVSFIS